MRLSDLFKKKSNELTFPENELEVSLMKAICDQNLRKEFITKLLWSDLYVLTETEKSLMKKGESVSLVTLGSKIPAFTSPNRIFDKGVIKEHVQYIALKGQNLFDMIKGTTLILNPYSDYGKEFLPAEIEDILNGKSV